VPGAVSIQRLSNRFGSDHYPLLLIVRASIH
jgi:hypothetical protein